jgi:hypothetical protein
LPCVGTRKKSKHCERILMLPRGGE